MTKRRVLARYGRRGDQVKVLVDSKRDRAEVHYKDEEGIPRIRTYPNDKDGRAEALAFGEAYLDERKQMAAEKLAPRASAPLTLRALWDAYMLAEFQNLRPKTRIAYRERWTRWERFMMRDALADDTTLDDVDLFRTDALKGGIALNQVRQVLNVARLVYAWGMVRKKIKTNELALHRWKQPKDAPVLEPEEYSVAELERMLRVFDPTKHNQWRPWVAFMLLMGSGQRANAILHLRWEDIEWSKGEIVWRAAFQKQGKELRRALTDTIYSALIVADLWRRRAGFVRDLDTELTEPVDTPWVLFALNEKSEPMSYSSLYAQLRRAEDHATPPVPHRPYRAFHGGRRTVVGEIIDATGDRMLGLEYVGDNDVKMLRSYDKRAQERVDRAAKVLEERR
jgi:integrase